jgi:hypothetical protein
VLLQLLTAAYGTSRTSQDVRLESAKWGKADIDQVAVTSRNFLHALMLGSARQLRLRLAAFALGETVKLQHDDGLVRHHQRLDLAPQTAQAQCDYRLAQLGRAGGVSAACVAGHADFKPLVRHWYEM